jgi:hypothetical protein
LSEKARVVICCKHSASRGLHLCTGSAVSVALINRHRIRVGVHNELNDASPAFRKWVTVHNDRDSRTLFHCLAREILAAEEYASAVEARMPEILIPNTRFDLPH